MALEHFHPLIRSWFEGRFGQPTEPQRRGWPEIAAGRNTLIAAPTGSGKTLAAFLICLDRMFRQWVEGSLVDRTRVVYVSPLKALSNDIERNLQTPLAEIRRLAEQSGLAPPAIRINVRTGDTPASERQAMRRHPPHILVTTPESLYLLITSERSRDLLRSVDTVIVDEIHALARDKRGSHLALSLERLSVLGEQRPVRIGLSATQRPIDQLARFLVGVTAVVPEPPTQLRLWAEAPSSTASVASVTGPDAAPAVDCTIVDVGHVRELDLAVETPASELSAVCSHEQWAEVYERLKQLIGEHRSTLVFVNTRRLAERVAHNLREMLGEDAVAAHHGSLSRPLRLSAEQRLKDGELKAIVATASLEMGIDIGYINLVCQIGSPRSIATFLQRVGRSGHSLGDIPKGRLFPLTRDELLECMALVRAVRRGDLDAIEIPQQPLDILTQQIVAAAACDEWDEDALYELCRRAWPYRNLTHDDYETVLRMASEGVTPTSRRGAYLHRDQINRRIRARKSARIAAITSGGAIPETAEYRVVTEADKTFVGTVDEDFAIESMAGDVFLLGNSSWRIRYVRAGEVIVHDAAGAPPTIPFWLGEAPGRTIELSHEISTLRRELASRLGAVDPSHVNQMPGADLTATVEWARQECGVDAAAAEQSVRYVESQLAAIGLVPTRDEIVFERFFDESGGMQLVIHSLLGARINRAWGLALRKRFCRSFDFELQAAATDNGILLSLGPQHSFAIESLFSMLGPHNARHLLEQALLAAPMFQVRWRWNVTRSLAVLRQQSGKKVPFYLQRFRADDLLASAFPETVGCLENHHGDVEIPDHPLVRQTMHDCLHEAMDLDRWLGVLQDVQSARVTLVPRDTREPSPFSHELLNANPYAFLDDAPLEERRTRAIATRRSLVPADFRDLARLDPEAIQQVCREAWPTVRDADELHDALMGLVVVLEGEAFDGAADWEAWLQRLIRTSRAHRVTIHTEEPAAGMPPRSFWIAAERWPLVRAVYPAAVADPAVCLPGRLENVWEASDAWIELVRGRITHLGPVTASELAHSLSLPEAHVVSALEALEGQGIVLRGSFRSAPPAPAARTATDSVSATAGAPLEWCDRRLLARIHRLTMDGLRRQIQPVEPADFVRYLLRLHRIGHGVQWSGPLGVREVVGQLQGFEMPAGAWESVLTTRVQDYEPQWLDQLFLAGETVWGRLRCPNRDPEDGPSAAAMTRVMPISVLLREDLPWLLPPDRSASEGNSRSTPPPLAFGSAWTGDPALATITADADAALPLRSNARQVLGELTRRGALFGQELKTHCGLLPTHLEDALRELAAAGLISSDGFSAVRSIAGSSNHLGLARRSRERRTFQSVGLPTGRWSLFPGVVESPGRDACLQRWCRQLLRRYGVVFRDLLTRESAAPAWHELVPVLRRMELRGEVRGGRFVSRVAGEQYAAEAAIEQLRKIRDEPGGDEWVVLSATDPANLVGVIFPGPRIPATHRNLLVVKQGHCVAARVAGRIEFFAEFQPIVQADIRRALQCSSADRRRPATPAVPG